MSNKKGGPHNLVLISNFGYTGPWNRISQDIQAWATVMQGDHLFSGFPFAIQKALGYKYILVELTENLFPFAKKLIKRKKEQKIIGIIEGSPHYLNERFNLKQKIDFIEIINKTDALATLCEDSLPFYQSLTKKNVTYIGVPVPIDKIKENLVPIDKRNKIITLASGASRPGGGITNLAALKEIQKEIKIPGSYLLINKQEEKILSNFRLDLKVEKAKGLINWENWIKRIASSFIVLNLDFRWTWGRVSCDCAALGIPCIGISNSNCHGELFPELSVKPFDVIGAKELAVKLLNSSDFYNECCTYAQEKVNQYDFDAAKKRMLGLLECLS